MFCIGALFSQSKDDFRFLTLKNGLRVVLQRKETVPLAHFVFAVGIGSKDDGAAGSVHLLEHILLFGSNRSLGPQGKMDALRRLGAYFNAHTNLDYMSFEVSVGSNQSGKVPALLHENIFEPRFLEEEIAGEKPIIIEEIRQAENDPRLLSTNLLLQTLFSGHPYGRPLLGQAESIGTVGPAQLADLHHRFFVPDNCVLAVVGRIDLESLGREIETCFRSIPAAARSAVDAIPVPLPGKKVELERTMDIDRGYLSLAIPAPHFNHEDRVPFSILVQILGRGRNPLLYRAFLPDPTIVDNLELQYMSMKEAGVLIVRVTAAPKVLSSLEGRLISFLRKVGQMNFSREDVYGEESLYVTDLLQGGKNLLQLASENSREEGLRLANAYASVLFLRDGTDVVDFFERIKKTKSTDLRRTADRFLSRGNWVRLSLRPLPEKEAR